jgi:hypothetical protein
MFTNQFDFEKVSDIALSNPTAGAASLAEADQNSAVAPALCVPVPPLSG